MPRAILALRRYPATMLLAALLFAASLILAATSMGTVTGGGEGDDGGSGIGGTGKSGEFGGSGFGGTGGPSPFFTSSAPTDDEQGAQQSATDSSDATPQLADSPSIEEGVLIELSSTLEANALAEPEQPESVSLTPASAQAPAGIDIAQLPELERPVAPEPFEEPKIESLTAPAESVPAREAVLATATSSGSELEKHSDTQAIPVVQTAQNPAAEEEVTEETAIVPAKSVAVAQEADKEAPAEPLDRASVPERIQRPELPPFQRIRPVERPSLLPSRVQPMRI